MDKLELRKKLMSRQRSFDAAYLDQSSEQISAHLISWLWTQSLQPMLIVGYYALSWEFSLERLYKHSATQQISLWLPRVMNSSLKKMLFFHYCPYSTVMSLDESGVCAPSPDKELMSFMNGCSEGYQLMMLIPALTLNDQGVRLGYGGGYYDRFLAQHQKNHLIQKLKKIAIIDQDHTEYNFISDPWDIAMDAFVTQSGYKDCKIM